MPRTNKIDMDPRAGDEEQISNQMLRSALVAGSSSSGIEIPWNCSTGNCTFPDVYSTLGICTACEDLSTKAVVELTTVELTSWYENPRRVPQIITSLAPDNERGYWEAGNNQLNTSFSRTGSMDHHVDMARMDIRWPPSQDTDSLRVEMIVGKTTFSDSMRLISTGKNITGCDTAEANDTWACRGYGAARCTLKPCVRTYSASIEAGHLKEQLISQSPDIPWDASWSPHNYGILDSQCVSAQQAAFLTARGYELNSTTRWVPFNGDISTHRVTEDGLSSDWLSNLESLLHNKCVYLMSMELMNKIGYGNGIGPWARNPAASQFVGTVQGLRWDWNEAGDTILNTFDGPEVLQNIYNYGRVDFDRIQSVFENISNSLTTFIRTYGNESYSESVRG